jgi:hypothetical protein
MRLKPQALGLLAILACLIAFWADADTVWIGSVMVAVGLADIPLWYCPATSTISYFTWGLLPDWADFVIAWAAVAATWYFRAYDVAVGFALGGVWFHLFFPAGYGERHQ